MKFLSILLLTFSLAFATQTADESDEFESEFKSTSEVFDPLSGYNRAMTSFNDFMFENVLDPVVSGYRYVMPEEGRNAVGNFFDNLLYPVRLINNLLQLKFRAAGDETLRFIANTIVGFAGISDVATKYYHIPRHDEDLGQTLGYWGVGSGFHIVLPFFGPSNLRDLVGMSGDYFAKPLSYVDPTSAELALKSYEEGNKLSLNPDMYKNLKKDAVDLYPFLRDAYEQRRERLIKE